MKDIMETVFIADDEANIRDGLKCIVDWEELGFTVCGEAGNGEDALKEIIRLNPSLVLLDIRMPKLYGLEVIEQAKQHGFSGTFVILSGYSDFNYAQTAMKFGVKYYLTKPMDEEELEKVAQNFLCIDTTTVRGSSCCMSTCIPKAKWKRSQTHGIGSGVP